MEKNKRRKKSTEREKERERVARSLHEFPNHNQTKSYLQIARISRQRDNLERTEGVENERARSQSASRCSFGQRAARANNNPANGATGRQFESIREFAASQ